MQDDMVEAVAKAIALAEYGGHDVYLPMALHSKAAQARYLPRARAAIAAMQPYLIAAEQRGAERMQEAAATVKPTNTPAADCETVGQWTRRTMREAIRALDPAKIGTGHE